MESLFREVADLAEAERQEYYQSRQVPVQLRDEVESLLAFDETQTRALPDCVAVVAGEVLRSGAGERCGPYVLDRLLGRGGMGMVYLARRADGEVLQHSFAVGRMVEWYRAGLQVKDLIPNLSVYLGHVQPAHTYWYLTATPELLGAAADRFQQYAEVGGDHD